MRVSAHLQQARKRGLQLKKIKEFPVKHEKYPALDSDSCLTESMAKLKFTHPGMAIVFPDEESEMKGFKTVAYHLVMLHHGTSCDLVGGQLKTRGKR